MKIALSTSFHQSNSESHHGSAGNISDSLLELLDTDTFILSTNGKLMNHKPQMPGKRTIARLIRKKKYDSITLVNNYDWWNSCYYGAYFTKNDLSDYITPRILKRIKLNQDGYMIKKGLKVYGDCKK